MNIENTLNEFGNLLILKGQNYYNSNGVAETVREFLIDNYLGEVKLPELPTDNEIKDLAYKEFGHYAGWQLRKDSIDAFIVGAKTMRDQFKSSPIPTKTAEVGDKIRFLKELTQDANEETPAFLFARKNEFGIIIALPKASGRYSVKWDGWIEPFYAEIDTEFEVVKSSPMQGDKKVAKFDGGTEDMGAIY